MIVILLCSLWFCSGVGAQTTTYIFGCSPPHYHDINDTSTDRRGCYVTLLSPQSATVANLSTSSFSESIPLQLGQPHTYDFGTMFSPIVDGTNQLGIRITTDFPIQVYVQHGPTSAYFQYNGAAALAPITDDNTEYFILGFVEDSACDTSTNYLKSWYSVAAAEDGTEVSITSPDASVTSSTVLNEYDVFTTITTDRDEDLSGIHITASAPVRVTLGTACLMTSTYGSLSNAPPSVSQYQHIHVPPMMVPFNGYDIKVLAVQDDTTIQFEDESITLNAGAFYFKQNASEIICSNKCLVTYRSTVSSRAGLFMFTIIPEESFYRSAYFSTLPQYDIDSPEYYVSLVVRGTGEMSDILLNGESLEDEEWTLQGDFSHSTFAIDESVMYKVESVGSKSLAAYVYSHMTNLGGGYAFSVIPSQDL